MIILVSSDPTFTNNYKEVFNNDNNSAGKGYGSDAEYSETSNGKTLTTTSLNARYVRFWSNGSTSNGSNHYCEVEIYGSSN